MLVTQQLMAPLTTIVCFYYGSEWGPRSVWLPTFF